MIKLYVLSSIIILLSIFGLFQKKRADHYEDELNLIHAKYISVQEAIDKTQEDNKIAEKKQAIYIQSIKSEKLSDNCQNSLNFAINEMQKI